MAVSVKGNSEKWFYRDVNEAKLIKTNFNV